MQLRLRLTRPVLVLALLALGAGGCASLVTGGPLVRDPNGPTGKIVIQNHSPRTVQAVLISACSVGSYGLNRLPKGTGIPPGTSLSFTVSPGCWDVMAGNDNAAPRRRVEVVAGGEAVYSVP